MQRNSKDTYVSLTIIINVLLGSASYIKLIFDVL